MISFSQKSRNLITASKNLDTKIPTQLRVPIGGTGALIQKINQKPIRENITPTLFTATPNISSLPYLSNDAKEKDNTAVFELALQMATKKQEVAQWMYTDQEQRKLQENENNDLVLMSKYNEPSTDALMREFLIREVSKRKQEEIGLQNKRMGMKDKAMEDFTNEMNNNNVQSKLQQLDNLRGQELEAMKVYLAKLYQLNQSSDKSPLSELTKKTLKDKLMQYNALPKEEEVPVAEPVLPVDLLKVSDQIIGSQELKNLLFNEAKFDVDTRLKNISKKTTPQINKMILDNKIILPSEGLTNTQKAKIIIYHLLSINTSARTILQKNNIPLAK